MNSALKPVLTSSTPQNPPVTTQLNKPMHPQGAPANYGQPSTHMPQSLVNLPHNPTVAHTHPNPAHQSNHYSLNVPNAPHYSSNNPSTIPASNHPVPNVSQGQGGQTYSPNKNVPFSGGYQPNLGHPPNQNPMPPVSQTLPATQPHQPPAAADEKPQSNGTAEAKSPTKPEPQENHVSLPRDKSPMPPSSPKTTEKPEEKPSPTALPEQKQPQESKPVEEAKTSPEPADSPPESAPAVSDTDPKPETPDTPEAKPSEPQDTKENITEEATQSPPPKTKEQKPKTTPKTARKSRTPKPEGDSPKTSKAQQKSPTVAKSKRTRTKTQPYQSPLPEIEIITKITSSTPRNKTNDDKLIVFYKNEFLAVRNSEGSFYICQAAQNIYKSSPKIRIRWLSQEKSEKSGEVYTPDFYDNTDFDCILTNLNLVRVDKGRYRLPPAEKERTDSILKRSLAVEKGEVTSPSLTEEHPDGNVSLYKEESQLKKRKSTKRKASSALRSKSASSTTKSPDQPKVRKVVKPVKKTPKKAPAPAKTKPKPEEKKPIASSSRTDRAKRRSDNQNHNKVTPVVDQKKAKVLAKVARKGAPKAGRNAKVAKAKKAAPKVSAKKTKRSKK
ncbi:proteoglycan 4 isoform X2 [Tribolium castaneum]|uniref:proteoglycan 4 isoform X2 n=2 Tax=Tribolium castaneum TaxID=7070 RepID=UPI00046BFFBF|nr:PREDICTED: proteoglycan 4 isoform X2 [Tribolium castaneum]|eukprot:XP_008201684.1 PREDICTED: proteoglycan 4 isoform X2 [Tribolium castaneum]